MGQVTEVAKTVAAIAAMVTALAQFAHPADLGQPTRPVHSTASAQK
jgi:hypothetical protein